MGCMEFSFKDLQFIVEAIGCLSEKYQERLDAIEDLDEDEASDLGNDCMFLELLCQDIEKKLAESVSQTIPATPDILDTPNKLLAQTEKI
ncbi:MAG: hypothetical protein F6J93_20080 [Oscillatoria sp. SIO1A7]|nr:hypothetical protein [Oscillatoria sp. SIO1A7]